MPRRRKPSKPRTMKMWVKKINWLDLPNEITANILHRLGAVEILESAQKVCTAWRRICKDPAMWRVINMENLGDLSSMPYDLEKLCMHAIDRSQGQLVDINIEYFGTDELMEYLAQNDRSSQLRRLQIACCYGMISESWSEFLKKAPLFEEISLTFTDISEETLADCGQYCPMLKSFKYNGRGTRHHGQSYIPEYSSNYADEFAIAVTKAMPQLCHLQLVGNDLTNKGLQAILDGCPRLESLDLRKCFNINLDERIGKLCRERIKDLRLPDDSMEGYKFVSDENGELMMFDDSDYSDEVMSDDYEDYEGLSDYDIYGGPYHNPFKDMFDESNSDEFSPFEEFLTMVHMMQIGNFSDSD